jgi:hypothetical protein
MAQLNHWRYDRFVFLAPGAEETWVFFGCLTSQQWESSGVFATAHPVPLRGMNRLLEVANVRSRAPGGGHHPKGRNIEVTVRNVGQSAVFRYTLWLTVVLL